ncbi:hypothetical protein KQX54_008633 [Cotesia glomerata]|uniref:Uncharacterized protein n=1 Tax=Cotesia glomerata TaxID=32391 RepID=A0AAV7HZE7_COTGL|nr:hypothetical protein KQX54_008633 [Cotesia glomerata]
MLQKILSWSVLYSHQQELQVALGRNYDPTYNSLRRCIPAVRYYASLGNLANDSIEAAWHPEYVDIMEHPSLYDKRTCICSRHYYRFN